VRRGYLEIRRAEPKRVRLVRAARPTPPSPPRCARSSRSSSVALDQILDQPRAVELLRRALAGERVAHAYAFVGRPAPDA